MSYKDITFCPYHLECVHGEKCHRALTDEIIANADKISLPIARFAVKPECFEDKQ